MTPDTLDRGKQVFTDTLPSRDDQARWSIIEDRYFSSDTTNPTLVHCLQAGYQAPVMFGDGVVSWSRKR